MSETAWRDRPQRGGRAGNLFFAVLARSGRLGLALVPFFLFWVALYFVIAAPTARRASLELARRLGVRGRVARGWFAFRHIYGYGRLMVERIAILSGRTDLFAFHSHGRPHLEAGLAEGRGLVLVTAHLGAWEIMAQVLQGVAPRVTLVMHDGVQASMRKTIDDLSEGRAFRVLWTDGSPSAAAAILAALSEGDLVGMMGDRVLAGQGVQVSLLDGPATFPTGPYAVAAAAKAPLLHAFAVREGFRRYGFFATPPEQLTFSDRRDKQPDLVRWASAFAASLEPHLRRHPTQWGNLFSVWGPGDG